MTLGISFADPGLGAGIRCGSYRLVQQAAPWRFALMHDRPDDLLLWITRGQGRVTVNGVLRGVAMHHAVYLPAGTLLSIDLQAQAQALLVESPAGRVHGLPQAPMVLRVTDSLAQAELTGLIDAMSRERQRARLFLDDALEAHMRLVGVWLHRVAATGAGDTDKETASQRLVRRYAQALVRSYAGARGMGAYAEALDVTPTHLSRACRQCCGQTAADMLTERKLHAARHLLEQPRPPIKDIAAQLGFTSAAYFSRFIQNHCGMSPSALRSQALARPARV